MESEEEREVGTACDMKLKFYAPINIKEKEEKNENKEENE